MDPVDDWCRKALAYRRIAKQIIRMEKNQERGKVAPEVRERAEGWMRMAREAQRVHEESIDRWR